MQPGGIHSESISFRDSVTTISKDGKRRWVFSKRPSGSYYNKRGWISSFFLILLFVGPFLTWNGHPLILFNVLERKFILFGIPFWPQDFFLFVLAMLTFFVFIILFTAIFGRVWCGWACPQTIFMEMVFRKVEYWIEGDANQQKQLAARPLDFYKVRRKVFKHALFLLIAFLIANVFLAYIVGVDQLELLVSDGPVNHQAGFYALLGFTGVFYGVYARFREQVCLVVCPYGRLQGVLLDRNSLVIAYDYQRGDPRGKLHKNENRLIGDCIDCHQCVDVCPTGIDIRNGTQLECVNCTACIDACDSVMEKVGFEKSLIRYASENNIANRDKFKVTSRIVGYAVLLLVLLTTLVSLLALRTDVEATLLRVPGQLYQQQDGNRFSNLYTIQVVNKTFLDIPLTFGLENTPKGAEIRFVGNVIDKVHSDSLAEAVLFIVLPDSALKGLKTPLILDVFSNGKMVDRVKTNFMGPTNTKY